MSESQPSPGSIILLPIQSIIYVVDVIMAVLHRQ